MLLDENKVVDLLRSPDEFVRDHAFSYFTHMNTDREDILPVLLASIKDDKWHYESPTYHLGKLPASDVALTTMIDMLENTSDFHLYNNLLAEISVAPAKCLQKHWGQLKKHLVDHDRHRARCRRKINWLRFTPEKLWAKLIEHCNKMEKRSAYSDDYFFDDASRALVGTGVPSTEELLYITEDERNKDTWLELAAIHFLGIFRVDDAIPLFLRQARQEVGDFVYEAIEHMLPRLNSQKVISALNSEWMAEPEEFRSTMAYAFAGMPVPDVEKIMISALESETSEYVRTILVSSLCQIYSDKGVEIGCREVERGYDEETLRLEDDIVVLADSLEMDFPHKEKWRNERPDLKEKFLDYRFTPTFEEPEDDIEAEEPEKELLNEIPSEQDVNLSGKISRNAPCPCGSGKKYKKCCARG